MDTHIFSHPLSKTHRLIQTVAFIFGCFARSIPSGPTLRMEVISRQQSKPEAELSLCFLHEFRCCRFEVLISELWTQLITTQNKQSGRSNDKRNNNVYSLQFPIFIFWPKPSTTLKSCKYSSGKKMFPVC